MAAPPRLITRDSCRSLNEEEEEGLQPPELPEVPAYKKDENDDARMTNVEIMTK